MTIECGICEFKGHLRDAPLFVCFNCGDAIRRLVWISEQKSDVALTVAEPSSVEAATAVLSRPGLLKKREAR